MVGEVLVSLLAVRCFRHLPDRVAEDGFGAGEVVGEVHAEMMHYLLVDGAKWLDEDLQGGSLRG